MASSNRIGRVNDDIQRLLSSLLRSVKDPRVNRWGMISVISADTTEDLRYSRIRLSVLGEANEKEFLKGLKSASGWLRREIGKTLSLRYVPELIFEIDRSIEHGAHINRILSGLDIRDDAEAETNDDA